MGWTWLLALRAMLQATESSSIQLACAACPVSAALKDRSGLPWGCVVRPFASPRDGSRLPVVAEKDIERCANCFAYPNHLCAFEYVPAEVKRFRHFGLLLSDLLLLIYLAIRIEKGMICGECRFNR